MIRIFLTLLLGALTVSGDSYQEQNVSYPSILQRVRTEQQFAHINEILMFLPDFTQLLVSGGVTVFLPSKSALESIPSDLIFRLMSDRQFQIEMMAYHVVDGKFLVENLVDGQLLITKQGNPIRISKISNSSHEMIINSNVTVVVPDIISSDGVIQMIDALLYTERTDDTEDPNDSDPATTPNPGDSIRNSETMCDTRCIGLLTAGVVSLCLAVILVVCCCFLPRRKEVNSISAAYHVQPQRRDLTQIFPIANMNLVGFDASNQEKQENTLSTLENETKPAEL